LNHLWWIAPSGKSIMTVATPLGTFSLRELDLNFNMGNHFNYTCIRHPPLKGATLIGITTPRVTLLLSIKRSTG